MVKIGRNGSHFEKMAATRALLHFIYKNYSKWIPQPQKPGYSHQNHNCMSSI